MNNNQYPTKEKIVRYQRFTDRCLMRKNIFKPTIQGLYASSLKGKRVIDIACGYGNSAEWLVDLEPEELVGVDLSPAMIDACKQRFLSHPNHSRFKFLVRDGSKSLDLGQFDIVQSSFYLSHAESKEQLLNMVKIMADSTKPGGICVGLMTSPFLKRDDYSKQHKYNFEFSELDESNKYKHRVRLFEGHAGESEFLFEMDQFRYEPEFYEKAFLQAGFKRLEWILPKLFESDQEIDFFLKSFLRQILLEYLKQLKPKINFLEIII